MRICQYLRPCIKMICSRFHIKTPFWDMCTWDMWKACLQTYRSNRIYEKLAYFLRNSQISRTNSPWILRIKNAKFSGCCFIWTQTQIFKYALVYLLYTTINVYEKYKTNVKNNKNYLSQRYSFRALYSTR